jgi:preprotein translocase subunit YajC
MSEFIAFSTIIILILLAYWSLVIYPKQRDFKKHNKYVRSLNVGDEVITFGGIIGVITRMDKESGVSYVKVADNVELKLLAAAVTRPYVPEDVAFNANIGVEDPAAQSVQPARQR